MAHSRMLDTAADTLRMPDYVDDRALSARTPIARVTWQTMRQKGEGPPFYRLGRRCLYKWSEVAAWIEAQRIGGAK